MDTSCECCESSGRVCDGPIPRPEESYRVYLCVLLSVVRCNNQSLQVQWVGKRGQTKKERKKERKIISNERISNTSVEPAAKLKINFVEKQDWRL